MGVMGYHDIIGGCSTHMITHMYIAGSVGGPPAMETPRLQSKQWR